MTSGVADTRDFGGSAAVDTELDEAFLDLVLADAELLGAAFEAIVAAEWGPTQPLRPPPPTPPPHPGRPRPSAAIMGPVVPPRHPSVAGWARARSPPPGRRASISVDDEGW
jgi:hypothetical protein